MNTQQEAKDKVLSILHKQRKKRNRKTNQSRKANRK